MKKTFLVFLNEFLTTILRPSFIFTLFGLPIISALIFGFIGILNKNQPGQVEGFFSPAVDPLPLGYIDHSGIINRQEAGDRLSPYRDQTSANNDLLNGKISGYYIIPQDYLETGNLTLIKKDFNPLSAFDESDDLQYLLESNLLGGAAPLVERYNQPLIIENVNINPEPERAQESVFNMLMPVAITILFYIILVSSATLLLHSITKEKENRVLEILMTSVSSKQILTGKILALGLIGLLQTGIWIGSGLLLVGAGQQANMLPVDVSIDPSFLLWSLIYFLGGYLLYASLMAGIGAMVPNLREASQATSLVLMPMIVPMVMINSLIQSPNGILSLILSFLPLTSPVAMLTQMSVMHVPWWQILGSAVLLFLFSAWIIRTISALFRGQIMLAGQPLSRARFIKALLGRSL